MKIKLLIAAFAATVSVVSCSSVKDGDYDITVIATGDGHGTWFSQPYSADMKVRGTLMAQSEFVNKLRAEKGADNVILVDAGDNLMGNNATFYYNYVDTVSAYPYPLLASYMKYDAVVAGWSDFEAGHPVYDRVAAGFKKAGIPFLAANAISDKTGKSYFQDYTILKKNGLKVAVLGYTNSDNASLIDSSAFSGIHFESLLPMVQNDVDKVISKEKPQVVIVVAHTGHGKGNGNNPAKEGLDLFQSLRGVDVLVTGYDHSEKSMVTDSIVLINGGRLARNVGVANLKLTLKGGKVVSKALSADISSIRTSDVDSAMVKKFEPEFQAVRDFTNSKVGEIKSTMYSREFYWGQCDYLNFLHTLALTAAPVDISFTATLLIDGKIDAGDVLFKDIDEIYPYANKLVVMKLSGKEVKAYLEASYANWINTVSGPRDKEVLKMKKAKDFKTGEKVWKLATSPANFDSGAGLCYTVDVTKPEGSRVTISSMADGSAFDMDKMYRVAITSYRASGSGGMLQAAGLDTSEKAQERIIYRGPEFRKLLFDYLKKNGVIDPAVIGDTKVVGSWKFVPDFAPEGIRKNVETIYGK